MQEFNKVSTISNFIKELLNTTYLPVVRTIQAGDYIVEGRMYLYHCDIIECLSSGYVSPYSNSTLSPKARFRQIGEYHFGDRNGKLCHNFQSNKEGYDSLTHEKLGAYLRALRDMYNLNLMPLYNCFSNNHLANYHIFDDRVTKTSYNYHTKLYKVPIRFNTDYTICMDNVGEATFAPAFIRNESLIYLNKTPIGNNLDITNRYFSLHSNHVITTYAGLRFNDPIVIRYNNVPERKTLKRQIILEGEEKYIPIRIDISTYFQITDDVTEENYRSYIGRLYVMSTDNVPVKVQSSDPFDSDATYYICDTDPSASEWYVQDSDGYSLSADTSITYTTQYYIKAPTVESTYYTYDINDELCKMYDSVEDTLYMLVQVPDSFNSNIVILEGDYTKTQSNKLYNQTDLRNYPENYLDKLFTHDIRLMRMNVSQIIPFSDTLVQFLLWNAIDNMDTINLDMDRILRQLTNLYMDVDPNYYANYWYYRYRELISNYARRNNIIYIDDNMGYVTSDVEALLGKNIAPDLDAPDYIGVENDVD